MTSNDFTLITDMIEGRVLNEGEMFYRINVCQGRSVYAADEITEGYLIPETMTALDGLRGLKELLDSRGEIFLAVSRKPRTVSVCHFFNNLNEALGLARTRRRPWIANVSKKDRLVINPVDKQDSDMANSPQCDLTR